MFDLTTTLDEPVYADGAPFRLTVAAADGRPIRIAEVRWTASDAAAFTVDGLTVTGNVRASGGHLAVRVLDREDREASTTLEMPLATSGRFTEPA